LKSVVADAELALLAGHERASGVHMTSWNMVTSKLLPVAHFVKGSWSCRANTARAVAWSALIGSGGAPGTREIVMVPVAGVAGGGEGVLGKGAEGRHRVSNPRAALSFLVAVVVHREPTLHGWRLSIAFADCAILLRKIPPAQTASLLLGKLVKYCCWFWFWF